MTTVNLSAIIKSVGRSTKLGATPVDVIEFAESDWGLGRQDPSSGRGFRLFPVQKIILKAHYGLPLDDNPWGIDINEPVPTTHPDYETITDLVGKNDKKKRTENFGYYKHRIKVTDWRRENTRYMTEAGYLNYIFTDGRCNIGVVDHERREMILSIGRRSGKTLIASIIASYETYKLILKHDPHGYYGISPSNPIHIVSVATDREQASLLYKEVSGHFQGCDFFRPYQAHKTQSFATFQTSNDIDKYGSYQDNPLAKTSIIVTFKSCVARSIRGMGIIVAIMDEMAHFGDKGQSSAEEMYGAIKPATSAYSVKNDAGEPVGDVESRIIAISSPLGRQGMFYSLFQKGMKGGTGAKNTLCIQAPTWEVNPTIPASEFEDAYIKDANQFFTEFGGEFSDRTRGWMEVPADLYACIDPTRRPVVVSQPRVQYYAGLDIALVNDRTAIAIVHVEHHPDAGHVIVLDVVEYIQAGYGKFEKQDRLLVDDVVEWIEKFHKRFMIKEGVFDQWSGIPFHQAMEKAGMKNFKMERFSDLLSSDIYRNFKDMMWDRRLVLYNYPVEEGKEYTEYIEELCSLQAEVKTKNITKVSKSPSADSSDDMSDAIVRAVWLASQDVANKRVGVATPNGYQPSRPPPSRFYNSGGSNPDRQINRGGLASVSSRIMNRFNRTVPRGRNGR